MPWSYADNRAHPELSTTELDVLHPLEKNLYNLIVPNIARRPRRVYHYTSDRGLEGIVRSHGLRATYWRDLIDQREIVWGASILNEAMQALRRELQNEMLRELLGMYYYAFVQHEVAQEHYIVCFTEAGESERHWIEYGCADTGFCLEVDAFDLEKRSVAYAMDLQPVTYDFKQQTNLILNVLLPCWRATMELGGRTSSERQRVWLPHVMSLFTAHIHFHLRLMKTEDFEWEREWRVVIRGPKPGEKEPGIKRFVHLPILTGSDMSPILAITARHAPSLQYIRRLIEAHGYSEPQLRTAESVVRKWGQI